ncbi:uncharacterized protein B0H18DRAFT_847133, partial [Fomitopsis serialis]|uniref:uncharacterized protein n=1 Tax=Fomitopsis serialis TaxID=139415 RepID=UPI0020087EEA
IRSGYSKDRLFQAIIEHPEDHCAFPLRDSLLWYQPCADCEVLCVLQITVHCRVLPEIILSEAHTAIGHLGTCRMSD